MDPRQRPQRGDLISGISVALVLIPQALAYAELAGMPPAIGLLAGTIPAIAAAFFASSPYLQTGPTALHALLVAGALSGTAAVATPDYVATGAMLALLVGVCRVIFGVLRWGRVAYLVSEPVLVGFTTGAAILVIASQVPSIVGVSASGNQVLARAITALSQPDRWSIPTIALAGITLVVVILGRRFHPLFPSVLVAVIVAWAVSLGVGFEGAVLGEIPRTVPTLSVERPWSSIPALLIPAVVIAVVGFAEPASIARTYAALDGYRWSPHREFVSQGIANLASGMIGAFPVGGSFGRSSLNRSAGAVTRWSGAVTGVALLAVLPITGVLASLPKVILAAVVVSAVISLIRPERWRELWRASPLEAGLAFGVLVMMAVVDPHIERAIVVGVAASGLLRLVRKLRSSSRPDRDVRAKR
ncbi:MAG: hypothetical protein CSA55_05865 [Ilumatobacter coccineus]|uniref:SLC26A/SulP transporter domain-containing protein n=1 Tax=Ilumatobacter coccineus TaxID=467094 RepID=A0A2G6K8U7_9ACTN|nr:MAG: hypothetical protein CSA55_05865 [Ilumatobacter coccineus]